MWNTHDEPDKRDIYEPAKESVVTSIATRYEGSVHIFSGRDLSDDTVHALSGEFKEQQRRIGPSTRGRRVCSDGTQRPVTPAIDLKPVEPQFLIPITPERLQLLQKELKE